MKNIDAFAKDVLPLFFKSAKVPSFYRQLQFYNFTREFSKPPKSDGEDGTRRKTLKVTHTFFVRNRPDLLRNIQRTATVDKSVKNEIARLRDKVEQLEGTVRFVESQNSVLSEKLDKVWGIVQALAARTGHPGVTDVLKRDVFRDMKLGGKRRRVEFDDHGVDPLASFSHAFSMDDRFDPTLLNIDSEDGHPPSTSSSEMPVPPLRITSSDVMPATSRGGFHRTYASDGSDASADNHKISKTLSAMSIHDDENASSSDHDFKRTISQMSTGAIEDYAELVRLLSGEGTPSSSAP